MAEKILNNLRIINKHDTEANWLKATNFVPKQGELIIYDKDTTYNYERFKIGDGSTLVSALPFADANKVDKVSGKGLSTNDYTTTEKTKLAGIAEGANKTVVDSELSSTSTNPVQNKAVYAKLDTLIGGTPVSEQINAAITNKVDKVSGKGLSTNDYTTNEKNKLSGIASGAEVNQNAFSNIVVGSTTISADAKTDTLTVVAGSNVTITPDATNDKITIAATDTVYTHPTYTSKTSGLYKITVDGTGHVSGATAVVKSDITGLGIPAQDTTYSAATTSKAGLMSATDKTTLNNLSTLVGDTSVSEQIEAAQIVYVGPTKPTDPNIKVWINTSEDGTGVIPVLPRLATVSLPKANWVGSASPYSQTAAIATVTSATKIDLQPTASQIVQLQNADIALMAENSGDTVTIYSFGGKPSNDMTMQVLLTEVSYI